MLMLYKCLESKTKQAMQAYHVAYAALKVLDPNGSWSTCLKELADKDISGPGRDHNIGRDHNSESNSHYKPLWIWLMPRVNKSSNANMDMGEDEFNESMRVE